MLVYDSIVRSGSPLKQNYSDFYKGWSDITGSQVPLYSEIQAYQMSKLIEFSEKTRLHSAQSYNVNKFLQNSSNNLNEGLQHDIIHNKIIEIESNLRDQFFMGKWSGEEKELTQDKTLLSNVHKNLQELYNLLIQISGKDQLISGTYINKLSDYINKADGPSIYDIMKNYWNLQGEILEAEGVEWFNKRVPSNLQVRAYNVGKLNIKGQGQMISDILILNMSQVDLYKDVQIEFTLDGNPQSLPLIEFLNKLETYTGTKQLVVDDNNIGKLISNAVMGIQAKSGINQLPWNVSSANTWVSIGDFENIQEKIVLDRIFQLRNTWDEFDQHIKTVDSAYNALADYGLATVLNKILHLGQNENSYLLTPSGFMTYEDRMAELFKKKGGKYYFHLNHVKMNDNLYDSKQVVMPT